jgi:hypothetical protein
MDNKKQIKNNSLLFLIYGIFTYFYLSLYPVIIDTIRIKYTEQFTFVFLESFFQIVSILFILVDGYFLAKLFELWCEE